MFKYVLSLYMAAWPAFALAGGLASAPASEPTGPLTLETALALADGANADLSAARHELLAVDGAVQQAGLLPNPSLSVERVDTRHDTRETTLSIESAAGAGRQTAGAHAGRAARTR